MSTNIEFPGSLMYLIGKEPIVNTMLDGSTCPCQKLARFALCAKCEDFKQTQQLKLEMILLLVFRLSV
jgi:hypothetical protein